MFRRDRVAYRLLLSVGLLLVMAFAVWWFRLGNVSHNFHGLAHTFDFIYFILLSYIIWHPILMELLTWKIARHIKPYSPAPIPQSGLKVAFITTYVPKSEPIELLHKILPALVDMEYPHDSWLLDEGDDPAARAVCAQYGVHYFTRHNNPEYNTATGKFAARTKGGNHNAWYDRVGKQYDIVAQIDTDFVPQKDFLTKTLGYFRDPTIAFVGTPQVYGNQHESWIAKGAAQQQFNFYGPILRGLNDYEMSLMLGANHVVRVSALKHIGYYYGHLTEDLITGMTLHSKWYRSKYVPMQLAVGEGPATWPAYFNQQMRWAHGCIDILFHYSFKRFSLMRLRHTMNYFLLQQHYFSGLASFLGICFLAAYFAFGINAANMPILSFLIVYIPLLVWQYLIHRWLQRFYINPVADRGFLLQNMLLSIMVWPIYFLALIGVLSGKKLTFKVTPKGEAVPQYAAIAVFKPHLIVGLVTLGCLLSTLVTHRDSVIMLFWAGLTTMLMLGIIFNETVIARVKVRHHQIRKQKTEPVTV